MADTTRLIRRAAPLAALASLLTLSAAEAVAPRKGESALEAKQKSRAELWLAKRNVPLARVVERLPNRAAWDAFTAARAVDGAPFAVFIDPVSGTATNITRSVPLIPGSGAGNSVSLQSLGRRLGRDVKRVDAAAVADVTLAHAREQQGLLGIDAAQLGAARASRVTPDLWQVSIPQQYRGVPVRDGHLVAAIGHGNLVLIGVGGWGNVSLPDVTPSLAADTAVAAGFAYADGRTAEDEVLGAPVLEIVGMAGPALKDEGRLAVASGYAHRLVWTFVFRRRPAIERWEVMVDATNGEVVSFQDVNRYAKRHVTGGVYPLTNTEVCPDPTACGVMQTGSPMPFADTGYPAPNDFSNSAGVFDFTGGSGATTLAGRFFTVQGPGPLSEGSVGGSIFLNGTNGQHDLESSGSSAGDTASARTAFYELNKIAEMARGWLPDNEFLTGDPLETFVNDNEVCNAFYTPGPMPFPPFPGGPPSIHFFRSGALPGHPEISCRNTGEIASVMDHEWGHWLDDHDVNQRGSAEAYGDVAALYRTQTSCLGPGFTETSNEGCGQSPDGTGPNADLATFGPRHCSTQCSGVREADWARHVPATPDDVLGFVCTACMGNPHGDLLVDGHCLAAPPDQAAWDFVTRDLAAPPFNLNSQSAFVVGNKLFYQGSGLTFGWFTFGHGLCDEPADGCSAEDAYMGWLTADDDNGNLNDGTPHMTALFNAFNRHGIACAQPAPVNSGCASGPSVGPTVSVAAGHYQAALSWNPVPNATRYWVFRSEGHAGCNYGKALIAEVTGTSYVDTEVAAQRPYRYNVVAAGAQSACFGKVSNCATVTPTAGSFTVSCAPTALSIGTSGGSATTTCTARSTGGYASPVSLACVGLPGGASCTPTPASAQLAPNGTATFSVRVTALPLTPRSYSFQVRGTPSAAPVSVHSAALTLTIGGSGTADLVASFDAARRAPSCGSTVGRSCDSGPSLVLGRGDIGPEPNAPNTINGSCADGAGGRVPEDGSNDRIQIASMSGPKFAIGGTVRVVATVRARADFQQDAADFFYAADANNPVWVYAGTAVPTAAGVQQLSIGYVLPHGALQALRVQFRQGGDASAACSAGPLDDHDDLIFAVGS